MYEKQFIKGAIERSAETAVDRRKLLTIFGLAGAGAAAATVAGGTAAFASDNKGNGPSDASVLNFALNLEYLEAEFYQRAAYGRGLKDADASGTGTGGTVSGGYKVPNLSKTIRMYAQEIADDELEHVRYLRKGLGSAAVARPKIDLKASFNAAAKAAGLGNSFDPFANETNFLLGAFLFEDVGVTAYKGAAQFLADAPAFLEAAAGILAVEAYHAGIIRSTLFARGEAGATSLFAATKAISDARDSLDGSNTLDQGLGKAHHRPGLVPNDANGIAYGRTPGQVLNVVYLNPGKVTKGGFYPNGVNGDLNTSGH